MRSIKTYLADNYDGSSGFRCSGKSRTEDRKGISVSQTIENCLINGLSAMPSPESFSGDLVLPRFMRDLTDFDNAKRNVKLAQSALSKSTGNALKRAIDACKTKDDDISSKSVESV